MVGGAFTVTVKLIVVDRSPASVTVSVMVVTPLCADTGVTVTIQLPLVSGPLNAMLAVGTSTVLLDAHVSVSSFTGVRSSPIVNPCVIVDTVPKLMS